MSRFLPLICCSLLLLAPASPSRAEPPLVVVSIKPVHALVAGVMQGVATPALLMPGAASPHAQSLKPTQARALEHADLVVWVGESLELFLRRPLAGRSGSPGLLTVSQLPELHTLPARRAGEWHSHGQTESGLGPHASALDPHLWLDPHNAERVVAAVAARLKRLDPGAATRYEANAKALTTRIRALDERIDAQLSDVRKQPYVVFHDAYQYFEHRYGTRAVGALTVSPDRAPGARRLKQLRERIRRLEVRCVFAEPQFEPRLVQTLVAGTGVRSAVLDPLGSDLDTGPEAWFQIMSNLATNLSACLGVGPR